MKAKSTYMTSLSLNRSTMISKTNQTMKTQVTSTMTQSTKRSMMMHIMRMKHQALFAKKLMILLINNTIKFMERLTMRQMATDTNINNRIK